MERFFGSLSEKTLVVLRYALLYTATDLVSLVPTAIESEGFPGDVLAVSGSLALPFPVPLTILKRLGDRIPRRPGVEYSNTA